MNPRAANQSWNAEKRIPMGATATASDPRTAHLRSLLQDGVGVGFCLDASYLLGRRLVDRPDALGQGLNCRHACPALTH